MLRAAVGFFVLGLLALVLGLGNVAGFSLEIGKMLLYVFVVLAIVSAVVGLVTGRSPKTLP